MATGLSLILFLLLLFLLSLGIWVAPALITLGYILLEFFTPAPVGSLLASTLWDASWNWALTALPLFIWMGEILFRTRLSSEMFKGLAPMLSNLPGGLLHVNVVGCGIMAAVAGSSAVTCATIGRMSIPELKKRNYDETLSIGSLAGSGTLGLLIPPSIMLIVYGVLAQVSISRLFIAGVLPGIMIIIIFMSYIIIRSKLNPALAPKQNVSYTFFEKEVEQSISLGVPTIINESLEFSSSDEETIKQPTYIMRKIEGNIPIIFKNNIKNKAQNLEEDLEYENDLTYEFFSCEENNSDNSEQEEIF